MRYQTDILIIGQGICGTFLSWELERAGLSYILIDEERPFTASKAAAGLINPVTGRRLVTTWMIDELLPFAHEVYGQLGKVLGSSFLEPVSVTDFFPTAQMRLAFLKRLEEDPLYLQLPANDHAWDTCFRYELGYGLISPCYLVDTPGLLAAARARMRERGVLRAEKFVREELVVEGTPRDGMAGVVTPDGRMTGGEEEAPGEGGIQTGGRVRYRDIEAGRVVFCDGIEGFSSPYFSRLPSAPNKGEALILEIPELGERMDRASGGMVGAGERIDGVEGEGRTIFKKGISLAPWRDGLFWVGSSYEWTFTDDAPTEAFRKKTEAILKDWLLLPFRTVQHIASVRPATLERRPFVGFHPVFPAVGILNGMGTKGCSLAPYFARQLVQYLVTGKAIRPDADIRRFTKVLSR